MDQLDFDEIMDLQRKLASEVAEEQETDNKITLMSIINDMTSGEKDIIQKERVIIEAQQQGLNEEQVERLLKELESDNFLIEEKGYIKTL